ncbi:MAG: alkaline phosphatase [Anaerolineales bacterium]
MESNSCVIGRAAPALHIIHKLGPTWAVRLGLLLIVAGFFFSPAAASSDAKSPESAIPISSPAGIGLRQRASAVILFIGDGMGPAQRTAARWQSVGQSGQLVMDTLSVSGWSSTASADSAITDSAAAGTAIATGVKTNNGRIAMDPLANELTTILELAKARGMSVGLVTTTQMAHATPAAFAAHVPDRNMMTEIAAQMLDTGVDVLLGGGEDEFLPSTESGCYPEPGERTDGRNLISEAVAAGYIYVCDETGLNTVDPNSTTRLLGLFADEGMIRPFAPDLAALTQKAIDVLSQDPNGFFLMVEGGQIDWAGHLNDAANAIGDTVDFDAAVAIGKAFLASKPDVLIIVTADHETGGMSVSLTSSGQPGEDGPFWMPDGTPFYVNWTTLGHTAADMPTTAEGPWSDLLAGTNKNTRIFEAMNSAIQWWVWLPLVIRS